ncbi:MAG: hypothetical protein LC777_18455, partial [Actinobacteria bacterium]|nr:hypothetical protein [Actinomycetota bacterium]
MISELNCLSLMELVDLRADPGDSVAAAHIADCSRCRALLASLPDQLPLPDQQLAVRGPRRPVTEAPTRAPAHPARVATGALWRAVPDPGSDFAWLVVIIGRTRDADDRVLVAPVIGTAHVATDADLLLDQSLLGYDAFVDTNNLGVILDTQLIERVADLPTATAQAIVALYRSTLGAGEPPPADLRGTPVLAATDPRVLASAGRADALRALWRPADRQVEDADDEAETGAHAAPSVAASQPALAAALKLDDVLSTRLIGTNAAWDRASLLEQSSADGARLDAFLAGRLDLTDKNDVSDLARILHTLDVPWDTEAKPAVIQTLTLTSGGTRRAEGPSLPMAARSRPGTSDEDVTEQLYA